MTSDIRAWPPPSLRPFLRAAAVCAGITAVTTGLLWLLPRLTPASGGFEGQLALARNPVYLARWGTNFVHNWLALIGYLGAAIVMARRSPGLAATGFLAFLVWAVTEIIGVSLQLWAVNLDWRQRYPGADAATQAELKTLLHGFASVWDGLFFVILVAFLIGTFSYGLASRGPSRLEQALCVTFLLAVPLTVLILLGEYAGMSLAGPLVALVYPLLQPCNRALLGIWLWRESRIGE